MLKNLFKMKKTLLYFCTFLLISVFSCKKVSDENSPNYYSSVDGISILNDDILGYIDHIESDTIIVFSGSIPDNAIPRANTNIYVPVSDKTPNGMLVKAISVNKGGYVYVTTSPLSLDEVFDYLSIDESFTYTTELEGVFDSLWNPIDFEIIDTADIDLNDTIVGSKLTNSIKADQNCDFYFDWNWEKECIKIPIRLYKNENGRDKIEISGFAHIGFRKFDFDIDINNHTLRYLNLDATPYVKIGVQSKVTTGNKLEMKERVFQLRFKLTILTPAGIPIIIPITVYVYGKCGIQGELSATLSFQREFNCNCVTSFRNGQWSSETKPGGDNGDSPLNIGEFDVKGEIYSGLQIGMIAGLYSATMGIGFNLFPNWSINADARLSSEDLLKTNPQVVHKLIVGSDIYCAARLFGRKLAKYSLKFPDYILFSNTVYLLPQIENYNVYGNGYSADISWSHGTNYFLYLGGFGVKTGTAVFDSDGTTMIGYYKPIPSAPTYNNNQYTLFYNENAYGLQSGKTYYAAPLAYWGSFNWYGDMVEFKTEGQYHLDFRCAAQTYDVVSFDFNLNNSFGNVIDHTTEVTDYNGEPLRVHITATFDASRQTLNGVFDWYSYNYPEQKRKDGFTVSLVTNDSGYVICNKIVDNGGCEGALRIYLNNSKSASKKFNHALFNENCNVGIFNNRYK